MTEQYAQNCSEVGIQFIPLAFETFGGFSETVRETLKRIATLADNRNLQSSGLSVAFSRLSQSVSGVCNHAPCKGCEIIDTYETGANL